MNYTRIVQLLLVALLITTAGCSSLTGNETQTAPNASPTQSNTTDTPTPTPQATLDSMTNSGHAETLRESGSFTTTHALAFSSVKRNSSFNITFAIDVDSEKRSSILADSAGSTITKYTTGDFTYQQRLLDDASPEDGYYKKATSPDASYPKPSPVNTSNAIGTRYLLLGDSIEFTKQGQATINSVSGVKYTLSDNSSVSAVNETIGTAPYPNDATLQSADATILVHPEGYIAYSSWTVNTTEESISGDEFNATYSYEYTATNLGETTVEDPDWLSYANETSESETDANAPTAGVTFDQRLADDGNYNVTMRVVSMSQADSVLIETESGEEIGTIQEIGGEVVAVNVEQGTTLTAIAKQDGESSVVSSYTVRE